MRTRTLLFTLLLPALLVGQTTGQERRESPRITIRRINPGDTTLRVFLNGEDVTDRLSEVFRRRARLGLTVNLEPRETDSVGAQIIAVTPGGPASKAGIRTGDLITKLNGQVIAMPGATTREGDSAPGSRLIELAAKLEPNDTIRIEYQRNGRRTTVPLITGDEPIFEFGPGAFAFQIPDGRTRVWTIPELNVERFTPEIAERMNRFQADLGPGGARFDVQRFIGGPFADLELASLNPDLAAYFGTTEGVLVLSAPANSSLGLKGGDVVLSIDGRRPTSPGSLTRILRSYEPGDTFKVDVMRLKRRETITGRLDSGVRQRQP